MDSNISAKCAVKYGHSSSISHQCRTLRYSIARTCEVFVCMAPCPKIVPTWASLVIINSKQRRGAMLLGDRNPGVRQKMLVAGK